MCGLETTQLAKAFILLIPFVYVWLILIIMFLNSNIFVNTNPDKSLKKTVVYNSFVGSFISYKNRLCVGVGRMEPGASLEL